MSRHKPHLDPATGSPLNPLPPSSAGSEQPRGMEPILNSLMQATLDVTTTSRPALRKRFEGILRGQVRDPAQAVLDRESVVAIVLSAILGKADGETYGASHARKMNEDRAAKAADRILALAAQPPAAPVESEQTYSSIETCYGCGVDEPCGEDCPNYANPTAPVETGCICQDQHRKGYCTEPGCPYSSAGTADLAEFRKLQDIIDNQADQILDLHEVLKSAYLLNEFIAGAYVLSLADFRYLNIVSTKIKAALPGGDVTPTEPQSSKEPDEVLRLRAAMDYACDLLAERTYGSSARSPGHNARLHLEGALAHSRPHQASTCEHDWKIWPETDGQEHRCMKCGEYRKTPISGGAA